MKYTPTFIIEPYKNASLYKMYDEVKDDKNADKYLALMNENIKDVETFSFTLDDINEQLGIQIP